MVGGSGSTAWPDGLDFLLNHRAWEGSEARLGADAVWTLIRVVAFLKPYYNHKYVPSHYLLFDVV